jgi:hypothetical protein
MAVLGKVVRVAAYAASRIDREHRDLLASFAECLIVKVEGVGQVLFCHARRGATRRS